MQSPASSELWLAGSTSPTAGSELWLAGMWHVTEECTDVCVSVNYDWRLAAYTTCAGLVLFICLPDRSDYWFASHFQQRTTYLNRPDHWDRRAHRACTPGDLTWLADFRTSKWPGSFTGRFRHLVEGKDTYFTTHIFCIFYLLMAMVLQVWPDISDARPGRRTLRSETREPSRVAVLQELRGAGTGITGWWFLRGFRLQPVLKS